MIGSGRPRPIAVLLLCLLPGSGSAAPACGADSAGTGSSFPTQDGVTVERDDDESRLVRIRLPVSGGGVSWGDILRALARVKGFDDDALAWAHASGARVALIDLRPEPDPAHAFCRL